MIKLKLLNGIKIRKTHRCALTKKYTKDISQTHRKLSQNLAPPKISVATCANVAQAGISKSLFDKSASIFTCASSSLISTILFDNFWVEKHHYFLCADTHQSFPRHYRNCHTSYIFRQIFFVLLSISLYLRSLTVACECHPPYICYISITFSTSISPSHIHTCDHRDQKTWRSVIGRPRELGLASCSPYNHFCCQDPITTRTPNSRYTVLVHSCHARTFDRRLIRL